jgi:hypothetical protein
VAAQQKGAGMQKKTKQPVRKLKIKRETIRGLTPTELTQVGGGYGCRTDGCHTNN